MSEFNQKKLKRQIERGFAASEHGKQVIFQKPNIAAITFIACWILKHILPYGQLNFLAALVFFGSGFAWSWMEIFQGDSIFRRLLGVGVMTMLVSSQLF